MSGLQAAFAVAVAVLAAGATWLAGHRPWQARTRRSGPGRDRVVIGAGAAVAAGMAVWLLTGWPVAGAWSALGGWAIPGWVLRARAHEAELAQADALATWIEALRARLAAGANLAEALVDACAEPPRELADELRGLGRALGAPMMTAGRIAGDTVLERWGQTMAGPGRVAAAVLTVAWRAPAGDVNQMLGALADQLRSRAAAGRRIERERGRVRMATWAIAGLALAVVVFGARADRALFSYYTHPGGEVVLAVAGALMAGGLASLARMDRGIGGLR
jgi:Flp pilus assembly protein TadB